LKNISACRILATEAVENVIDRTPRKPARAPGKTSTGALPKGKDRRRKVVLAAYQTLAEKGFEGLRMREIARRAGIDHATLHYYFAGKEALIHGVFDYIVQDLSLGRNPETESAQVTPRQRLAAHFEELKRQMRVRPEMFIVLAEINTRSTRDPRIRSVVARFNRKWKSFLLDILREGIERREFPAHLDPESAAEAIISLLRGLSVTAGRSIDRALGQLAVWLEIDAGGRP
jgi:AcrR family transcriptional regulator